LYAAPKVCEIRFCGGPRYLALQPALFYEWNEEGAGACHDIEAGGTFSKCSLVRASSDGALGPKYSECTILVACERSVYTGLDHAEHTDVVRRAGFLKRGERERRGGVAGDHQGVNSLVDQVGSNSEAVSDDGVSGAGAIGYARGVSEIE